MLLVDSFAHKKWCKKAGKWPKPWQMGTHLRVLSKAYPRNAIMTEFGWFSEMKSECSQYLYLLGLNQWPKLFQESWLHIFLPFSLASLANVAVISVGPATPSPGTHKPPWEKQKPKLQFVIMRRLFDLLVPGSFPDQFYRVGREVIKNKLIFWLLLKYILKPYFWILKECFFNKRMHFNYTVLHCYCNVVLFWY